MANKRITKQIRKDAIAKGLKKVFETRGKDLQKRAADFLARLHDHYYGKDVAALKKVSTTHQWLTNNVTSLKVKVGENLTTLCHEDKDYPYTHHDKSKSFLGTLIGGYNAELKTPLLIPHHDTGEMLLKRAKDIKEWQAMQKEGRALYAEEKEVQKELFAFFEACRSYKDVEANWIEGLNLLPAIEKPKQLPVPLIDTVRKSLRTAGATA